MPSPEVAPPEPKGEAYGEKAKQEDFVAQTKPAEQKPLVPNVYQPPEPDELPHPDEPMTQGNPLDPEASSVLFGQQGPNLGATPESLKQWLPVLDELASTPGAHPLFGDLATRARQQLGAPGAGNR